MAAAVVAMFGLSCHAALQHFPKTWDRRVSHQNEAGTIHVGVQSTAAFDEYVSLLQPSFSLTSEQALAKAIPIVQSLEFRQAVAVSVAAALSLSQTTGSTTVVDNASRSKAIDSASEVSSFEKSRASTETKTPGAVDIPELAARIEGLLDKVSRQDSSLAFEPTAQYQAAASLLQQVAILNSYVKEAAVSRDTIPFVVRLLVSVFPNASRSPYNAFVDLRFAPSSSEYPLIYDGEEADQQRLNSLFRQLTWPEPAQTALPEKVREEAGRAGMEIFALGAASNKERDQEDPAFDKKVTGPIGELSKELAQELASERFKCSSNSLEILPLFATDSLEATDLRSMELQSREYSGSLGGSVGTAGGGFAGRGQSEASGSGAGRELRGVLTLAQAGAGHLSIRIGAMANETSTYLAPRTYRVALLALVPARRFGYLCRNPGIGRCEELRNLVRSLADRDSSSAEQEAVSALSSSLDALVIACPGGRFVGRSRFRHAVLGVELYQPSLSAIESEFEAAIANIPHSSTKLPSVKGSGWSSEAISAVFDGKWNDLPSRWRVDYSASALRSMQLEAERLLLEAGFLSGDFQVPARFIDFFRDPGGGQKSSSQLVLFDDEKSQSHFDLAGARSSAPVVLDATLFVTLDKPTVEYTIESTAATKTANGWRFSFPTLKPLFKPMEKDKNGEALLRQITKANATVRMYRPYQRWRDPEGILRDTYEFSRVPVAEEPALKPTATIAATQKQISVAKDGTGVLQIEVGGKAGPEAAPEIRFSVEGGYLTEVLSPAKGINPAAYEVLLPIKERYLLKFAGLVPNTVLKLKATQMVSKKDVDLPEVLVTLTQSPMEDDKKAASTKGKD